MSIIQRLKAETQHLHSAVERDLRIMRPDFRMAEYRDLLARFYGIYKPAERNLSRAPDLESALPDWKERRKTEWLVQDLEALSFTGEEIGKLSLCDDLPDLNGIAEALGCFYVLEGSTLGGQIITRRLQVTLRLDPDVGMNFFRSYQDQVGAMWRTFQQALLSSAPEGHDRMVQTATQTFAAMHRWLN